MTAKHFVPSFKFSTQCTPGVVCLLCYYPHLDRPALYFFAALSIVEGTPGDVELNFPGHPGIWSWDHLHETDTLPSQGESMAKITGYIRFRVGSGWLTHDRRYSDQGQIFVSLEVYTGPTTTPPHPNDADTILNQTTVTAILCSSSPPSGSISD